MRKFRLLNLAAAISLVIIIVLCSSLAAFANNTFKNPVNTGGDSLGDTYAFEDNGWYYMYGPNSDTGGGNVVAYKSQNLLDWTYIGIVYTNVGDTYYDGSTYKTPKGIWAPEVHYINGKYYLIITYVTDTADDNDKDIVVIEGSSPTTFDPGTKKVMLGDDSYNLHQYIDPHLFLDTDGMLYMYYKFKENGVEGSEIRVRPMSDPFHFSGSAISLTPAVGNHEHPYVDLKNGHYILFWSSGVGFSTSYKIEYATSSSPTGPFTNGANSPIMYSYQTAGVIGCGATSIVKDGAGDRWMVYRQKTDAGDNWYRIPAVNRVVISSNGTVDILPTRNTYVSKPVPLTGPLPANDLMTRVENTSSRITYTGTWNLNSDNSDSGGSTTHSGTAGDSAELVFNGDTIRVAIRTGINSGNMNIKLDGVTVASNVDTYSSPIQYQQIIYENDSLTEGSHTISIEATGTQNPLSGSTSVRLDYFEYHGTTTVDNDNSALTYSGSNFKTWSNTSDYGGSMTSSQTAGEYVQYTFSGTNVKIYARKASGAGKVDIYLDGVLVLDNYDLYSSPAQYQALVYDSGTLSAGTHTVKYVTTGLKNASSSGYGSNFDYLTYHD